MNSVAIRILSLKMKIKFQSRVHVEFNGQHLTTQLSSSQFKYHFNQDAHIRVPQFKNIIDLQVVITTDKGARYIAGNVTVTESELQETQQQSSYFPLNKCFDHEAKLQLQLIRWGKRQGICEQQHDRFRNKHEFDNRQNHPLRYRNNSKKDLNSESNNDSCQQNFDAMQINHIKSKLQRNKSTIFERNKQIKELLDKVQQQQNIISLYQSKLLDQKRELQQLEQKFFEYEKEFEEYINVQKRKKNNKDQEYQEALRKVQDKHILQFSQQSHYHEFQVQKLKEEIDEYKVLDNLQSELRSSKKKSQYNIFSSNDEVRTLEGKIKRIVQDNEQTVQRFQSKIGKLNNTITKLEKDKQTLEEKISELNSIQAVSSETSRNMKKKQDENSILKKKIQRLEKSKQTQKINLQEKAKASFDALVKQRENISIKHNALLQERSSLQKEWQQLTQQNKKLKILIIQAEKNNVALKLQQEEKSMKIKQLEKSNRVIEKELQKMKEGQQAFDRKLKQQVHKFEEQTIKKEQLNVFVEEKQKKIQNLQHCVNRMKLQLQSKSNSVHYYHQDCRIKQEQQQKTIEKLKSQTAYQQGLINQSRQTTKKQEQIIKQLESEKINHLNSLSILKKQLSESTNDFLIIETSLKEKKMQISAGIGEKQSLLKQIKKLQKQMQEQKEKHWMDLQKIKKTEKNLQLTHKQKQQIKEVLKEKNKKLEKLQELDIEKTKQMSLLREENTQLELKVKNLTKSLERWKKNNAEIVSQFCEIDLHDEEPCQVLKRYHKREKNQWIEQISRSKDEAQMLRQQLHEKNNIIEDLMQDVQHLEKHMQSYGKDIEYLQQLLNTKQEQLENLQNQHSQFIQIHEEYIFSYNKYKVEKEDECSKQQKQNHELKQIIESLENKIIEFEELIDAKNQQIVKIEIIKEQQAEKLKSITNNKEKLDLELENLESEIKSKDDQIKSLNTKFYNSSEEVFTLQIMNNDLEKTVSELEQEIAENKEALMKIVMSKEQTIHESIEINKKISSFEMQLFAKTQDVETFAAQNHSLKEQIKQLNSNDRVMKNQISNLHQDLTFRTESYKELEKKYSQISHKYENNKKELIENELMLEKKVQKYSCRNEHLETEIILCEEKLQEQKFKYAAEKLDLQYKIDQLTQQVTSLTEMQRIDFELTEQMIRLKQNLAEMHSRNSYLEDEINIIKSKYKQLLEDNKQKQEQLYIATGKVNQMEQYLVNEEKISRRSIEYIKHESEEKMSQVAAEYDKKLFIIDQQLISVEEREQAYQVSLTYKEQMIHNLQQQLRKLKNPQNQATQQQLNYYKGETFPSEVIS